MSADLSATQPVAPESMVPLLGPRLTFGAGHVLAGRYEIVQELGRGGMGEVYEVNDLELRTRVALKTIRTDRATDVTLTRFRREIYLARQVTHPNVCRMYDLGHHANKLFLTMELLAGDTLAKRIACIGHFTASDALPIIRQIASAIDAAHGAGVVHRDLKPSNVILARDGLRATVTDFGIAHAAQDPFGQVSYAGDIIGSPDYMAPEQIACGQITPATDIFSLGVIMYEMMTGARPFHGRSARTKPVPPRTLVPDLDPRWNAAILRCLAKSSDKRFASAAEVVAAIEPQRSPTRSRRLGPVVAVAATALAAAATWRLAAPGPASAQAPVHEGRPSIAVIGFNNLSARSDTAWLASAVGESLAVDLAAGDRIHTISGEEVATARAGLALPDADGYSSDTLHRLHDVTGADLIVVGSYLALGTDKHEQLQLNMRLQDTRTGATVVQISDAATIGNVLDLVHHDGERLRSEIGIASASESDERAAQAALPTGSEALQRYSSGVARLRAFDAVAARPLLEQAAELEPDNALVHARLSEAWLVLGYERNAETEIRKATKLASALPATVRALIEARAHEVAREWDQAIAAYRALASEHPDVLEYQLRLATVETHGNRGTEALRTISELRLRGSIDLADPRIDLAEAKAAEATGDFLHQEAAAKRAGELAGRAGAQLLVAHSELYLARALELQGKSDQAIAHARTARQIFATAGDKNHEARALAIEAFALSERGEVDQARQLDEQVLEMRRETGDRKDIAKVLINVGLIEENRGRLERAKQLTLEALDHARAIGDRSLEALALVRIAATTAVSGDPAGAIARADEAIAARAPDDLRNYYFALECRGASEAMMGRLDDAREHVEQAIAVAHRLGALADVADDHVFVANLRIHAGDLAGAHRALDEATAATADHRPEGVAWHLTVAARLALAEHRPEQAAHDARYAFDRLVELGHAVEALEPATTLTRALLARGDLAAAREAVDRLAALNLEGAWPRLTLALLRAELVAASGAGGSAAQAFAKIRDEASTAKLALVERDARGDLARLAR